MGGSVVSGCHTAAGLHSTGRCVSITTLRERYYEELSVVSRPHYSAALNTSHLQKNAVTTLTFSPHLVPSGATATNSRIKSSAGTCTISRASAIGRVPIGLPQSHAEPLFVAPLNRYSLLSVGALVYVMFHFPASQLAAAVNLTRAHADNTMHIPKPTAKVPNSGSSSGAAKPIQRWLAGWHQANHRQLGGLAEQGRPCLYVRPALASH